MQNDSGKISLEMEADRRTRILKKKATEGNKTAKRVIDRKKPSIIKSVIRFPFMLLSLIVGCVFMSLSAIFAGIHYALKAPNFALKKLNEGSVKLSEALFHEGAKSPDLIALKESNAMQDNVNIAFNNSTQNVSSRIDGTSININNTPENARLLMPIWSMMNGIFLVSLTPLMELAKIVIRAGQFLYNTVRHPLHTPSNLINFARNLILDIDNLVTKLSVTFLEYGIVNLGIVKNTFTLKNDPEELGKTTTNVINLGQ